MIVAGSEVNFKLDTGADISCLPIKIIKDTDHYKNLKKSNNLLYAYNNEKINPYGKIALQCFDIETKIRKIITFEVVDDTLQPILSRDNCVEMRLINRVDACDVDMNGRQEFINNNKDVFDGLGKIPGNYNIILKENSIPQLKYKKRIPESLHKKLKHQLELMIKDAVISPVDYPTDWINNLQIVEKPNGSLRLCLDPFH